MNSSNDLSTTRLVGDAMHGDADWQAGLDLGHRLVSALPKVCTLLPGAMTTPRPSTGLP
jgi:hypothetical protein